VSKRKTIKKLKGELKSLKAKHHNLLWLIAMIGKDLVDLQGRHQSLQNATATHLDVLREDYKHATNRSDNIYRSLELTDEVLEDVVRYLKALPNFQDGPSHPFTGRQNASQKDEPDHRTLHPLN